MISRTSILDTIAQPRLLVVNADDFGMSSGVNRGVVQAHREGIVTSTSLMVRGLAATEAASLSRENPGISVGLHVDLGEWAYRDEEWVCLYQVTSLNDGAAVAEEVRNQLRQFRKLTGKDPSHLDSHQHLHREEPIRSVLLEIAAEISIPLRHFAAEIRYCGEFYGQDAKGFPCHDFLATTALLDVLARLPVGITELACHPGCDEDFHPRAMYRSERKLEVQTLCDPRVRAAIDKFGIKLCSFQEIQFLKSTGNSAAGSPMLAIQEGIRV
jgi:predicted glycoside hydrolase/deacetylase ChbG (UPF0249 family)